MQEENTSTCSDGEKQPQKVSKRDKIKAKAAKLIRDSDAKRGIVYLSRIPTGMNVKLIRERFDLFGPTDRIFLQPDGEFTLGLFVISI